MMNLLGSHDTQRFLTLAGDDIRRLKLAFLFSFTYVGAPTIYYGDEIGMRGGGDPDCRRPFYWRWQDEPERVRLHAYVCKLIRLRRQNPCLSVGGFETLIARGRIYAYRRYLEREEIVVVLNADTKSLSVEVPIGEDKAGYIDILDKELWKAESRGGKKVVRIPVEAISGRLLKPKPD